ncbi:10347_t:CDS:1, partial [Ambispora leptoticha]
SRRITVQINLINCQIKQLLDVTVTVKGETLEQRSQFSRGLQALKERNKVFIYLYEALKISNRQMNLRYLFTNPQ